MKALGKTEAEQGEAVFPRVSCEDVEVISEVSVLGGDGEDSTDSEGGGENRLLLLSAITMMTSF